MDIEYKITFKLPAEYSGASLFRKLPSPIHRKTMTEIYNYAIEADGFYFVDRLVDMTTASSAFRMFIDEALSLSDRIAISKPRQADRK